MKMKMPARKWLPLAAAACVCCALNLAAQTPPTITTQPLSQTNLAGTTVAFTVAVSGAGPFAYQWQFNGTNLPNDLITTVAGNGTATFTGDDGAATNASLADPYDVAFDAFGNMYIADKGHQRIREVSANGIITTVAGNGGTVFSGDGGAATNAGLYNPSGVAVDAGGNLYIADTWHQRIRKVDTSGVITTVAGNGAPGYSGDGVAATNTSLYYPAGVAVDAGGNVYIADTYNTRIRKVATNGLISTVAGNGLLGYSGDGGPATNANLWQPGGLALDGLGNLYIADEQNDCVRRVGANGIITTVAGNNAEPGFSGDGGTATNASMDDPEGVCVDAFGNLYVADTGNQRIRQVTTNGIITTLAGDSSFGYSGDGGPATNASLFNPSRAALDAAGNLYIADDGNGRIREVHLAGFPTLALTNLASNFAGNYAVIVTSPYGSVTSKVATLVVAIPPSVTTPPASQTNLAGTTASFTSAVSGTGPFTYQWQLNGTNLPNNIITTVAGTNSYGFSGDGGPAAAATLYYPYGVAMDSSGNLYIADTDNYRIRKMDTNGILTTVAGTNGSGYSGDGGPAVNAMLDEPSGVAVDSSGNLYIADTYNQRIRKVATNGIITTVAGTNGAGFSGDGGAATNAMLYYPEGAAVDLSGNLYIADTDNQRIRKVATNGIITTVAGTNSSGYSGDGGAAANASLYYPTGVAVDSSGNLYIADTYNQRIRKVAANGIITTVAGTNGSGYSGDGGAAINSTLFYPDGLALDGSGNLYIADTDNSRIRKVATNGIITTVAGTNSTGYSGDGGPATNASLYYPFGVAVGSPGNLYIADTDNNRIRMVLLSAECPRLTLNAVGAASAGNYAVVVTSPYGSVTSAVARLTVLSPPSIVVQPASQGVVSGSNATFSVTAAGNPPLCYSWYFDATNLVQSGTNSTLTVQDVSTNNAGNYTVVVTNAYGSLTSSVAGLTLMAPPFIISGPSNQTALPGATVSFSVTVGDTTGPFIYQWQFNGANLPTNIITTVAGNGSTTFSGDGGPAINASLYSPMGTAVDASGNVYIADQGHNVIRKVDLNGMITTVAGGGTSSLGDGGQATNASLNYPIGVALDTNGNLYIVDDHNNRIRKVATNGVITTVAGNGAANYTGDGGQATNATLNNPSAVAFDALGNLYITDNDNDAIRKVNTAGIITTVADGFDHLHGIAVDAFGNLYVSDYYLDAILEVAANGMITTLAGISEVLAGPDGLSMDAYGSLYIADYGYNRIWKVATNGNITTVAGSGAEGFSGDGGAAASASLYNPWGVSLDVAGNVYIADYSNQRIRKVLAYGGYPTLTLLNVVATNAGNYTVVITTPYGSVTSAVVSLTVEAPPVITVQPASQFVAEGSSATFSLAAAGSGPFGYLLYFGGTNLVQSGTNSALTLPAVSTNNTGNYTLVVTNAYGSATSQVASLTVGFAPSVTSQTGEQTVLLGSNVTLSVAVGGTGPFTYQWQINGTNLPNNLITTVAGTNGSGYSGDGGQATKATLDYPYGVAVDAFGNVYIADTYNQRIRKVAANGTITTVAGTNGSGYTGDGGAAAKATLYYPYGVAVDSFGNLYIADTDNSRIRKVATNGIITTVAGTNGYGYSGDGGPATNARLYYPYGVAVDLSGNLYIADTDNSRIRKVATNGIITTVAGTNGSGYSGDGGAAINSMLNDPRGVAVDSSGNLYIADIYNSRIRKVATNGIITTVAGTNGSGYSGDGGPAANARLYYPYGVAMDSSGNLYIADSENSRIREVATNGIITTVAGTNSSGFSGDGGPAANASLDYPGGVAVDSSGNLYIADTDNQRIREVQLAGFPTLVLTNVSTNNAGNYTVLVTGPFGSVTSAVATVNVALSAPQILTGNASFGFLANQFGFNLSGPSGLAIVVDGSTDLVTWTPLLTNTSGSGSPLYFYDPYWTNFPWRFYRARLP